MKPLIDADVLRYELGSCGQYVDENGQQVIRDFEFVSNLIDDKIKEICDLVWATEPPLIFLTVDSVTKDILNRDSGLKEERIPNFREAVAQTKPYKGTRKAEKPYHYKNITAYLLGKYDCVVAEGLEADDLMAVYQTQAIKEKQEPETIICTRDKDLRMVDGWHFGWACGNQGAFGPEKVQGEGYIKPIWKTNKKTGKEYIEKISGVGFKFFCSQMITGDTVDNIPGLPRKGPSAALQLLEECNTTSEMLNAVIEAYKGVCEGSWKTHFFEQSQLLWMVRELDEEGKPIMFNYKDWIDEN